MKALAGLSRFVVTPGDFFSGYDGEVLTRPVRDSQCNEAAASSSVPLMLGAMAHEWRAFLPGIPATRYLDRFYQDALPSAWDRQQRRCLKEYSLELFAEAPCPAEVGICNLIKADEEQAATQVYTLGLGFGLGPGAAKRYEYLMDTDAAGTWCGACHSQDLVLVLDHEDKSWKEGREAFRELFVAYLSSFVRSRVPEGPKAWLPVADLRQGTPHMKFNFSQGHKMSDSAYYSIAGQNDMMNTLCGTPLMRCAQV